jgi:hypothetical protein
MTTVIKPSRLAAIEALPEDMQDHALVEWATVATLCGYKNVEHCREIVSKHVPLVHMSERRKLPTWGKLREYLKSREAAAI